MAQHDYVIDNQPGAPTRADLNALFQAIASQNSGAVEPVNKFAGQIWLDLGAGAAWPNGRMRMRNQLNTAWLDPQFGVSKLAFPSSFVSSADANTLDDYREGTFVPTISFGGAAVGVVYVTQSAFYTKVGNLITYQLDLQLSAKGTSVGSVVVAGLPYTVIGAFPVPAIGWYTGVSLTAGTILAAYQTNAQITMLVNSITGSTQLADTQVTNTFRIRMAGSYCSPT